MGKFKGIITAIITPFDTKCLIYEEGIRNEIRYLRENGIHNLFICGSYGAFPLLSLRERKLVAEVAVEEAKRFGMKSIVQIGSPSTLFAIDLAKHAERIGADAVSAVLPFYYSTTVYNDDDFVRYFDHIISSVSIDVHCYNNPGTTGVNVSPSLLDKLIKCGLRGMKDGGSDMGRMLDMMNIIENSDRDFDYYPSSTSSLVTGFILGADSCISGVSLTIPDLVNSVYTDVKDNNILKALETWKKVMAVREVLGKRCGRAIAAYSVLNYKEVRVGICRLPWKRMIAPDVFEMVEELKQLGVL